MSRTLFLLALSLLLFLGAASCKSSDSTQEEPPQVPEFQVPSNWNDIVLYRWQLIELNGKPIAAASHVELELDGTDRVLGHSGVNQFMGSCRRGDNYTLDFGAISSTKMAGSPEAMQLEAEFLAALQEVQAARMMGDKLALVKDGKALAVFHSAR